MGDRVPTRSWWEAAALQLRIRARYAAESRLGTKPFTEPALNMHPADARRFTAPPIDDRTQLGIKLVWALAGFFKQSVPLRLTYIAGVQGALQAVHRRLYDRVAEACEAHGPVERGVPLPEYDWRNGTPEEFYERFVATPHPVVLRGFASDTDAVEALGFDKLLLTHGDEKVLLTRADNDGYEGELRGVDDPDVYVHNCEVLFRRYPELLKGLNLERLEPYLRKKLGYAQLFVGRRGTGTPFHAAAVWNWFVMVDGRKTWHFVDPRDSVFVYPFPVMGRAASFALCLFPDEYDEEAYPAFAYCPYYSVTLEPGDVLLNPPWWWHAVKNETETSVGVASRWHGDGQVGRDDLMTEEDYGVSPFFSWLFQTGLGSVSFLHRILRDPSPPAKNGHTLRERNNRFVDRQRKLATQEVFGSRVYF